MGEPTGDGAASTLSPRDETRLPGRGVRREVPALGHVSVVLVAPRNEGNVGAVARLVANFGLGSIVIVAPECDIHSDLALARAMDGRARLQQARVVDDLPQAIADASLVVATTATVSERDRRHRRRAVNLPRACGRIASTQGPVALLFGRENWGLSNEEVAHADIVVTIPTDPAAASLNLSHAVAVLAYELFVTAGEQSVDPFTPVLASAHERDILLQRVEEYLQAVGYPHHKIPGTLVLLRRVLGHAEISRWELYTLCGVFRQGSRTTARLRAGSVARGLQRAAAPPPDRERPDDAQAGSPDRGSAVPPQTP